MNSISASDWESGKCFLGTCTPDPAPSLTRCTRVKKGFQNPQGTLKQQLKPKVCVCAHTCVYCMCEHVFVYCMCVMPPSALQPCEVKPLHSTTAKGALVMPRPSQAQQVSKHPHEQFLPLHQEKYTIPPLPPPPLPLPPPPPIHPVGRQPPVLTPGGCSGRPSLSCTPPPPPAGGCHLPL